MAAVVLAADLARVAADLVVDLARGAADLAADRRWRGRVVAAVAVERRPRRGGRGDEVPSNGQYASFGNRRRTTPPVSGSVAITARNSAFNAAPYSLNGLPSQKPYSANNTLNANIGGPVHIPKIVNWPRAQFTVNFSTTINRNGKNMVGSVPTPAELGGDFSQIITSTPVTIYDPLTGAPFANNLIPTSRINSAALGLLKYFPNPTYPGIVQNYRLDHHRSEFEPQCRSSFQCAVE